MNKSARVTQTERTHYHNIRITDLAPKVRHFIYKCSDYFMTTDSDGFIEDKYIVYQLQSNR